MMGMGAMVYWTMQGRVNDEKVQRPICHREVNEM
jgi:hypothetical protein